MATLNTQQADVPIPRKRPNKEGAADATQDGAPSNTVQACADPKITVVIDPGHGDRYWEIKDGKRHELSSPDPGTVYPPDNQRKAGQPPEVKEKDIALEVSKALRDNLTGKQYIKSVVLTREADVTQLVQRYEWRKEIVKANDARVVVSVHVNSVDATSVTGHIVFYYAPNPTVNIQAESTKLATEIDKTYKTIAAFKSGGTKGETARMGLIRFGSPYPVKAATLVELGFIGNSGDRASMKSKAQTIGAEIAAGVATYIKNNISTLCPKP